MKYLQDNSVGDETTLLQEKEDPTGGGRIYRSRRTKYRGLLGEATSISRVSVTRTGSAIGAERAMAACTATQREQPGSGVSFSPWQ